MLPMDPAVTQQSSKQAKSTPKPLQWEALWGPQEVLSAALQNIVFKGAHVSPSCGTSARRVAVRKRNTKANARMEAFRLPHVSAGAHRLAVSAPAKADKRAAPRIMAPIFLSLVSTTFF